MAILASKESGKILIGNFNRIQKISKKSPHELVTNVDILCEKKIISILSKKFPSYSIQAEESGSHDNGSDFKWVIDPLDGTHSYIYGLPTFGVSIALEYRKKIVLGVVCIPFTKETFHAVRGSGAFENNKKISVSGERFLKDSMMFFGGPFFDRDKFGNFSKVAPKVKRVRINGSAVFSICYVAKGKAEFYLDETNKYHDYAASALILQEAGGRTTDLKGKNWEKGITKVLASNGLVHDQILNLLGD